MLTIFGKEVRKARVDKDAKMTDMAEFLDVSLPYLSAVENGKKPISEKILKRTYEYFKDLGIQKKQWAEWAEKSSTQLKLDLIGANDLERQVSYAFGRNFKNLSAKQHKKLLNILREDGD